MIIYTSIDLIPDVLLPQQIKQYNPDMIESIVFANNTDIADMSYFPDAYDVNGDGTVFVIFK